ncbi:hypothetical protein [Micromonospora sp. SL4-19]|uniref:hypothetical protein n=1 Tax=Micromonospora sp. SL4-19 TaxID=3399129 RepID=UPI003A4E5C50
MLPASAGVLLAIALTSCMVSSRAEGAGGPDLAGEASTLATEARRVSLVQKLGVDGPVRTLYVDPSGRWTCQDCAGDGVESNGTLKPDQTQRLQRLLADPALVGETDEARQYKQGCIDALTSTLLIPPGLAISSQDCPGEEKPPVANKILLLLTQATPAEYQG